MNDTTNSNSNILTAQLSDKTTGLIAGLALGTLGMYLLCAFFPKILPKKWEGKLR